jgi:trehalose synthase
VVVWRCHVGIDRPNEHSESAWRFLRPYLEQVDAAVFTLRAHAPDWLASGDVLHVVAPSLDPFSPKNRDLTADETRAVLTGAGLFDRAGGPLARLTQDRAIDPDRPLVTQVSRWDRLKDMPGVLRAYADHVADGRDADLLLAGPDVAGVADDPAAADALARCEEEWRALPAEQRERVHLATLSMADPDANALLVNALQRHAAVVAQKSLAEGFGLTVTEAMWKGSPVVASAVGGIAAQITDGVDGVLVDPSDLAGFGSAVARLLDDRQQAAQLGAAARDRVTRDFLVDRHLLDWGVVTRAACDARDARTSGRRRSR